MTAKESIFPINEKTILLVNLLTNTMALVEQIHPIVTKYQKEILEELEAKSKYSGEPITEPFNSYQLPDEQFKIYLRRCDEEAAKNNLQHDPDHCPLLTAEELERQAKRLFGEYIFPFIPNNNGMTYDSALKFVKDESGNYKLDKLGRHRFIAHDIIDMSLKMILPFINPKDLIVMTTENLNTQLKK